MRDVEIPKWLEGLPLAPEFRPTDTEFADPIAYISKIEKEASAFGICKVIPPFPKPSKKYVLYNLNKSLSKCPELGSDVNIGSSRKMNDGVEGTTDCEFKAVFTTRHQELGQSGKRAKGAVGNQPIGAPKQVWQSGEVYTLEEFEAKSKNFAKSQLGMVKEVAPLVIEAMFWKATSEKPIYVEYANDVPGSGFGEPEGSFRYFNRQRRRRRKRGTFDRNNQGSSCSKNDHITNNSSSMNCSSVDKNADVSNLQTEVSGTSTSLPSLSSDQSNIVSQGMFSNASDEMQGTAGWKLSNSSWNLQVIARSPGSITRYMPDDIPGVTSPMVYIGMLFSWFAWHVEDHELHSLNFLHTGSPKTWYAVPGDYAFDFEEVIRLYAYGGDTNSLDALTLLGEKTTLFSPEIIVAAGIPCCRLVQNPGEFVVTFPRAYHVGFSHGFNCGEAANFSTPKWLTVAKGAAVRRAAMNYLPMLSHQQLLYLLTMSFVSRVPRCLLPGARSSRLKDRQKEERELSVKKAFLEDILSENRLLTILLQKNPSYHVVLWDLDLLPASSKDSELCSTVDADGTKSREDSHSGECDNQDLYTQMSLYMDTFTDFYLDDADDLQNDYQVDSGTLPCVACGILGFPFMAVVQPSEQASRDLLPEDQDLVLQLGVSQPVGFETLDLNCRAERSAPDTRKPNEKNLVNHPNETSLLAESNPAACPMKEDQSPLLNHSSSPEHVTVSSAVKPEKMRNLSTEYLRPRLFCLEHAIQTVELLRPKGGANVLGICHSDFQKIKAQSAVVAEEISSRFTYNEIPLGNASPDDLYLIDHAIDNQENDECTQDWTSKLNINLRHCVKMRKNFPSQNVKHALTLGGLFSDTVSKLKALKWQSRKSRTKHKSSPTILSKQSLSIQTEKVEEPVVNSDSGTSKKLGKVIIQYYRKRCKSKPCGSEGVSKAIVDSDMHPPDDLSAADGGYCDKKEKDTSQDTLVRVEDAGNGSSEPSFLASSRLSKLQSEDQITMSAEDLNGNSSLSKIVDSYIATTPLAENIDARTGNHMFEELIGMDKICDPPLNDFQKLPMIHVVEDIAGNHDTAGFENSAGSIGITMYCNENSEVTRENRIVSETNTANWTCDLVETDESGRQCNIQADGDVLMKEASNSANLCPRADDSSGGRCSEHLETTDVDECGMSSGKKQKEIHPIKGDDQEGAVLSNVPLSSKFKPTLSEGVEAPGEMAAHEQQHSGNLWSSSSFENKELNDAISTLAQFRPTEKTRSKRKREVEIQNEDSTNFGSFSRSPCEGLRPRAKSDAAETDSKKPIEDKREARKVNKHLDGSPLHKDKKEQKKGSHRCSIEGCRMSFQTKSELVLHMHDRCPIRGCGKKFNSHKYAILHQRVHDDDRPLKCPWKGCTMTFKWAWARTEHIRVHTGERPYKCKVEGCGLTFRFVSDFSRHRRKTGHYVN